MGTCQKTTNQSMQLTQKLIERKCKEQKLYKTPYLNDVLYLHYLGIDKIENLEQYTEVKCLWLENNAISQISGLNHQTQLRSLFLQNNAICKIENLTHLTRLNHLNLSNNLIEQVAGLDSLLNLTNLDLSNNQIKSTGNLEHLANCTSITALNLSGNKLNEPETLDVLCRLPHLKVLDMRNNPLKSSLRNYRRAILTKLKSLTFLDDRPVSDKERFIMNAYAEGGPEFEQKAREEWQRREHSKYARNTQYMMDIKKLNRTRGIISCFVKKIVNRVCHETSCDSHATEVAISIV